MVVLDDDVGTGLRLAEGGAWSSPEAAPARQPRDLRSRYERERARADAAETRCEELRRAEVDARSRAGLLKTQLDKCRGKLKATEEETREVRRTAKNALALQGEVARLEKLLSAAGVESSKRSTIVSLRMEVARVRTIRATTPLSTSSVPHPGDKLARLGADGGDVECGGGEVSMAEHRGDGGKRHADGDRDDA